jgi:hypothetical protein
MTSGRRGSQRLITSAVVGALVCLLIAGIAIGRAIGKAKSTSSTSTACRVDAEGFPTCPVTYAQVSSHEESHLYYPGSTVFSPFGSREVGGLEGKESAFAGAVLTTTAPPDTVMQWYAHWASSHGWTAYAAPRLSNQTTTNGYYRGKRENFIVAIDDPAALGRVLGRSVPTDVTVYEVSYSIHPYYAPTPSPQPK